MVSYKGYKIYVPIEYITDNHLNVDYNLTELDGECDEVFEVLEIAHKWTIVKKLMNQVGWYPLVKLVSIK